MKASKKNPKKAKLLELIKQKALIEADTYEGIIRSASGERSGWLFDLRNLFTKGAALDLIAELFWEEMEPYFPFQVGGLETGAIPLVAAILMKGKARGLDVNGFFVRKSRKKSGLCKQIEGELTEDPIVIVDDLINSGSSLKRILLALEASSRRPSHFFVVVDFGREKTHEWLKEQEIELHSLFTLKDFGKTFSEKDHASIYPKTTFHLDWVFEPPDPNYAIIVPKSSPAVDESQLYYGTDGSVFYALDLKSGKVNWSFPVGEHIKGIFSSPALFRDMVYFGAYDGTVYALDKKDGNPRWEYLGADYVGSSPVVAPDLELLFIGLEHNLPERRGSLVALDLYSGERVWEYEVKEYLHGTPAYEPKKGLVAVGTNDATLLLLEASSGELIWEFKLKGPAKAAPIFDLKRNQVIVASHDWYVYGIDIDSGKERFRFKTGNVLFSTPLLVDDLLFVGSTDKNLYVYDLEKKVLRKKIKTLGRIFSYPTYINGRIFFGSNDGCLRVLNKDTLEVEGGICFSERIVSRVVYAPNVDRYYAVLAGNQVICLSEIKK